MVCVVNNLASEPSDTLDSESRVFTIKNFLASTLIRIIIFSHEVRSHFTACEFLNKNKKQNVKWNIVEIQEIQEDMKLVKSGVGMP